MQLTSWMKKIYHMPKFYKRITNKKLAFRFKNIFNCNNKKFN